MLTSPSNRGRDDLRCPMGCRVEHARLERNRLSSEYYKTPEGREKKKELNKNRKDPGDSPRPDDDGSVINRDADLESYLKSILPMIEGRAVEQEEIRNLIQRSRDELRQYSLGKEEKPRILPDE